MSQALQPVLLAKRHFIESEAKSKNFYGNEIFQWANFGFCCWWVDSRTMCWHCVNVPVNRRCVTNDDVASIDLQNDATLGGSLENRLQPIETHPEPKIPLPHLHSQTLLSRISALRLTRIITSGGFTRERLSIRLRGFLASSPRGWDQAQVGVLSSFDFASQELEVHVAVAPRKFDRLDFWWWWWWWWWW